MASLFKLEGSRIWGMSWTGSKWQLTIIIEDGDLHYACTTKLNLSSAPILEKCQLDEEFLVRLPLVVVHNGHTDLEIQ